MYYFHHNFYIIFLNSLEAQFKFDNEMVRNHQHVTTDLINQLITVYKCELEVYFYWVSLKIGFAEIKVKFY